ncbi:MAG: hypothetical protein WBW41_07200 [Verrucomicrobiia bacterium]
MTDWRGFFRAVVLEKIGEFDAKRAGDGVNRASAVTVQQNLPVALAHRQTRLVILVRWTTASEPIARRFRLVARPGGDQI